MSLSAILAIGFLLGMRHATDADHVVAVSAIVSRERSVWAAAPIGALWGLGHSVSIVVVGKAIILFDIVIPPRVGLGLELSVAAMLILLGGVSVVGVLRKRASNAEPLQEKNVDHTEEARRENRAQAPKPRSMRPLAVVIMHGLAGSAAATLLIVETIHDAAWALGYLMVFCVGTVAGMWIITTAMALPLAAVAQRFVRLHRMLGVLTGLASIAFGGFLVYQVGFVDGLFMRAVH